MIVSHVLSNLTLRIISQGKYCYYTHFTNEGNGFERINRLLRSLQLVRDQNKKKTKTTNSSQPDRKTFILATVIHWIHLHTPNNKISDMGTGSIS